MLGDMYGQRIAIAADGREDQNSDDIVLTLLRA